MKMKQKYWSYLQTDPVPKEGNDSFLTNYYTLKAKILPVLLLLSVTIPPIDVSVVLMAYLDMSKTDSFW